MMNFLKESPLFPLELGTKVNLIGVAMLWWDMSATGDGKIKKLAGSFRSESGGGKKSRR